MKKNYVNFILLFILLSQSCLAELVVSPPILDMNKDNKIYIINNGKNDVTLNNGTIIKAHSTYEIRVVKQDDFLIEYDNVKLKIKVVKPFLNQYLIYSIGTIIGIGALVLIIKP